MRKKKLKQLEEEQIVELEQEQEQIEAQEPEQEEPVELTEDEYKAKIDALNEELRVLAEKEDRLTDKLCAAKATGLKEQTDRCRDLLQYLVHFKNGKLEELEEAKAAYHEVKTRREIAELTCEIDEIEADLIGELLPDEDEEPAPSFEPEYDYAAKSKRLSIVSRIIAILGCFGALAGALIYMVLVFLKDLPFAVTDLIVFGGVAVVMIIVAIIFGAAAKSAKRRGEKVLAELAEAKAAYEAECLAREAERAAQEEAWKIESMDVVSEAYAIEQQKTVQLAKDAKREKVKNTVIAKASEVPAKIKENANTVVPIAAACTAVVAAAAISSACKKAATARRTTAARRNFLDWLIK